MKLLVCCLCWLISLLPWVAQAQHDVILRTDGQEIKAKVLVIRPTDISYLPLDSAAGDTARIAAAEVFLIRYANGARELIRKPVPKPIALSSSEAISQGTRDARKYYRAPGAFWGTYGATIVTPLGGIAAGAAIAANRPAPSRLKVPDATLLQNPDYVRSYQRQAQRKKLGSAAAGFGAGIGTLLVIVIAVVSSLE